MPKLLSELQKNYPAGVLTYHSTGRSFWILDQAGNLGEFKEKSQNSGIFVNLPYFINREFFTFANTEDPSWGDEDQKQQLLYMFIANEILKNYTNLFKKYYAHYDENAVKQSKEEYYKYAPEAYGGCMLFDASVNAIFNDVETVNLKIGTCLTVPGCHGGDAGEREVDEASFGSYTVEESGETLENIAEHYGLTVPALKRMNGLY